MAKLLPLAFALLLLDVFPGGPGGCGCAPSTTAGPCQTTCDCDQSLAAPVRCPGGWECSTSQRCEYRCRDVCLEDGGCRESGEVCSGATCSVPLSCP